MRRLRVAAFLLTTMALAGQVSAGETEPGLLVRLYDVGVDMHVLPELVAGQMPNAVKVAPSLDLSLERKDFGDLSGNFLTEVLGQLEIEHAGSYTLRLLSDDGARLWLDGREVIDHDGRHGPEPKDSEPLKLSAGAHELRILHFQSGGGAQLALRWRRPEAAKDEFELVPATALRHPADASKETAPGKKKIIAALRRGRGGDGRPLERPHPGFGYASPGSAPAPDAGLIVARGWFHAEATAEARTQMCPVWIPANEGEVVGNSVYSIPDMLLGGQKLVPATVESKRVYLERQDPELPGSPLQGCVFRFGASDMIPAAVIDRIVFEMFAVRALTNGLAIEFTKPLDPRVGWEADAYYIEQWPFEAGKGTPPRRDGVVYPVKSASVSPDRYRVFLEIPDLKPGHVVYLRLLPPCLSEEGELPRSTEAWYTLGALPPDRVGEPLAPPPKEPQNVLTDEEQRDGWRLLFDGQTPKGWHGYKKEAFPEGWKVIDGCLVRVGPGGDIATDEQFDDFELQLEWRISAGGNSGIFFRVSEERGAPWDSGPEMQVLDDHEHADGRNPRTSAGSNYGLHAPARRVTQPVGLFNKVRIVARGPHVEYWLNGAKVIEYELGSPEWEKLVAASKFSKMPHYGREAKGCIVLQDHGDKVWYRNVKIRSLRARQ